MNCFDAEGIWHNLRMGACGVISWTLTSDSKFSNACSELVCGSGVNNDPQVHMSPILEAAANCIGQMAVHDYSGDRSSKPLLEPWDNRCNILNALPNGSRKSICARLLADPRLTRVVAQQRKLVISDIFKGQSGINPGLTDYSNLIEEIVQAVSREIQAELVSSSRSFLRLAGDLARASANAREDMFLQGGSTPLLNSPSKGAILQRRRFSL